MSEAEQLQQAIAACEMDLDAVMAALIAKTEAGGAESTVAAI